MILMDINIPKRSGIVAVEILRSQGYLMPIFALTAETDKEETDKAIKAGCQGVLSKPIYRRSIEETLYNCFNDN